MHHTHKSPHTNPASLPKFARNVVRWLCPAHLREEVAGDLAESFARRAAKRGKWHARFQLCADLASLPRLAAEARRSQSASAGSPQRRGDNMFRNLAQEFRYAIRTLRRTPGFTAVTVLTLALGIGANAAIFTFVNAILLQPLPYKDPDALVSIGHRYSHLTGARSVSALSYLDYREWNRVFESEAAYGFAPANLAAESQPERIRGYRVTEGFFRTLGIQPSLGRAFSADDYRDGAADVLLLSDELWRRSYGSDAGVLGKTVRLDGRPHTVIGVMPAGFYFRTQADVYRPLVFPQFHLTPPVRRGNEAFSMIARLKPDVSLAQAQADFDRIAAQLRPLHPQIYPAESGWRIDVTPYRDIIVGNVRPALLMLTGVAAFVLLIACANIANLLLARAEDRRKEFAVRMVLGAGRAALTHQLMVECALLALLGGALGLLVANFGVELFAGIGADRLPRLGEISVDSRVLLFLAGACGVTTMLFGAAPVAGAWNVNVQDALHSSSRGASGNPRARRIRNALVIGEVALSLPLLAASVLLADSLWRLTRVDPGFDPSRLLTFRISLPAAKYDTNDKAVAFFEGLLTNLRQLPGVRTADAVSYLPISGGSFMNAFDVEGNPRAAGKPDFIGHLSAATPGYFDTLGIRLLKGRFFTAHDTATSAPVIIIDEALAAECFPGLDPIGRRIDFEGGRGREVVGVVAHVKQGALDEQIAGQYYVSFAQSSGIGARAMDVALRTHTDPLSLSPAVRAAVRALDADQPMYRLGTMEESLGTSLAARRFNAILTSLFGTLALVLAAGGFFAVMSRTVARQTRDIGIRMALGAQRESVLRLVLSHSLVLASVGVAIGLALSVLLTRSLAGLLYGVSAGDARVLAGVSIVMLLVSLLASYVPARRAMEVDPAIALRAE